MIDTLLDQVRVLRIKVSFESCISCKLPAYLGSTLRGAVGMALKRSLCTQNMRDCRGCPSIPSCIYPVLFETHLTTDEETIRRMQHIPHPVIFEPPRGHPIHYQPGDAMEFGVVLFGNSVRHLPYMLHGLQRAGEIGLGYDRAPFRLSEIRTESGLILYRFSSQCVAGDDESRSWRAICESRKRPGTGIQLHFLTPTRIMEDGKITKEFSPAAFAGTLLRRCAALILFHAGATPDQVDFRQYLNLSPTWKVQSQHLRWKPLTRYSNRQKAEVPMDGLIGDVTLSGDFEPLAPFLALGEYVHIGKGAIMGLGHFFVTPVKETVAGLSPQR